MVIIAGNFSLNFGHISGVKLESCILEMSHIKAFEFSRAYLFILRGEGGVSLQHIHCYEEKNLEHFYDQIKFRDFIRSHPEYAKEYELLKQELFKIYFNDRKKYTEGKQAFFNKIKQLIDEDFNK